MKGEAFRTVKTYQVVFQLFSTWTERLVVEYSVCLFGVRQGSFAV